MTTPKIAMRLREADDVRACLSIQQRRISAMQLGRRVCRRVATGCALVACVLFAYVIQTRSLAASMTGLAACGASLAATLIAHRLRADIYKTLLACVAELERQ